MVDLALTDDERIDMAMPCIANVADQPDYPWGLRITLSEKELSKLGLDCDCEIGEVIDLRAFGEVTSVSTEKRDGRDSSRVEIQLQKLALEQESDEMDDDEDDGEDHEERIAALEQTIERLTAKLSRMKGRN